MMFLMNPGSGRCLESLESRSRDLQFFEFFSKKKSFSVFEFQNFKQETLERLPRDRFFRVADRQKSENRDAKRAPFLSQMNECI